MHKSLLSAAFFLALAQAASAGKFIPVSGVEYKTDSLSKIVFNGGGANATIDAVFSSGSTKSFEFSNSGRIYFSPRLQSDVVEASTQVLALYPNPASSRVTLSGVTPGETISVYSALGNMVASVVADGTTVDLDIDNFRDGIYFVKAGSSVLKLVKR